MMDYRYIIFRFPLYDTSFINKIVQESMELNKTIMFFNNMKRKLLEGVAFI